MSADIPGLTERERILIANTARYHRNAPPKLKPPGFAATSSFPCTLPTANEIERWAGMKKSRFFQEVLDVTVEPR